MGNRESRGSQHSVIISNFSGVYTHEKDTTSCHNLIEAITHLDKHDKYRILKSGISAKCVVFEEVSNPRDRERGVNTTFNQIMPFVEPYNNAYILNTAKDLAKYGAAVFNARANKIYVHYYGGKDFKYILHYFNDDGNIDNKDFAAGNAPLHRCCIDEEMHSLKKFYSINFQYIAMSFLLNAGASVNIQNKRGETPLHLCILNKKESLGLLLLQNGASLTMPDENGDTPLHYLVSSACACTWKCDIFKTYNQEMNPNLQNSSNMTPLHVCYKSYCEKMKSGSKIVTDHVCWERDLFDLGANPNIQNSDNKVPFQLLMCENTTKLFYLEKLKIHIHAGLDIIHVERFLMNLNKAYFNSLQTENLEVFKLLLECGAKPGELYESDGGEVYKQYRTLVIHYASHPLSLMRCSANVIRVLLMPNAIVGVNHINLPTYLKDYLNFNTM